MLLYRGGNSKRRIISLDSRQFVKRVQSSEFRPHILIIFGKMNLLIISENPFFLEIKCNGMTSFMEFLINMCISNVQTVDDVMDNGQPV